MAVWTKVSVLIRIIPGSFFLNLIHGMMKDLHDFRAIIDNFVPADHPQDYTLFIKLYPSSYHEKFKTPQVKQLSFIICHAPLFYRLKERYKLLEITHSLKRVNAMLFSELDLSGLGNWKDKVKKSTGILNEVYNHQPSAYTEQGDFVSIGRNAFEHHQSHNKRRVKYTDEDVDAELKTLGSAMYSKIYYEISSKFPVDLVRELRIGELNYEKGL